MLAALLLAGTITAAASAQAAASAPMTLAQAIQFAESHNQQVLLAKAQWVQAGATLTADRAAQLPGVQGLAQSSLSRNANYAGSFAQANLLAQPNFSQNTAELAGSQSIFNLQNELTADSARHAYDQTQQNYRLVKEQTVINVETSFYTYVQDIQLVGLAKADLAYQQQLYAIADANYKSGLVAGIDRLKAQVQRTSSEESLASATADAEDSRENLAQTIGADPSQPFVVPQAIPAPPMPSTDQRALDAVALMHRPDVAIAKDGLDIAVLGNALVDAPNRPTVALQGAWGNQVLPTKFTFNEIACKDQLYDPHCGATHFYTIGLTSQLLLPLIDWGTLHAQHNGAHANIDSQTASYETARRQAIIDVDQAARRIIVDDQNLALATQNASVAQQAAKIAQVQYKVGLGSQIDVTTAEQTYLQAAKQLLDAQVAYALAADKLKLATGTLVE
ncbi:MAG TPA: TolC family protein [Candidatus Eremiobacteraceae bacterium]|nr:TolC family protein [Candidatus Eremiobacteraceae bacterium]